MGRRWPLLALAAVLLAAPAEAHAGWRDDAARASAGLDRAVAEGRVAAIDAERYREDLRAAVATLPRLPSARARNLAAVLGDVAAQAPRYRAPRALALFSMLRVNTAHLAAADMPPRGHDVHDADGVVYRSFPGRGLQFHPLGSFGRLNRELTAQRVEEATRLAYALLARGQLAGDALVWEYYFRFAGGRPPWTSGMAQAVAAQALARLGLRDDARRAYLALPRGLLVRVAGRSWVRLYGFNRLAVLNAQLQAVVSLREYGRLTGDEEARQLAGALHQSAAALLPRFDTGFWSLYALGGREAPLHYHRYVVSLLWQLGVGDPDGPWRAWATRFRDYWRKPPEVRALGGESVVYPLPADGFKDAAGIRFWLSKPATMTIAVGGARYRLWLGPGPGRFLWWPGRRAPGRYPVVVAAVDRAGNRVQRALPAVVVRRDTVPPRLRARLAGSRLVWRATDDGTAQLRLRLLLRRGGDVRVVQLGLFPLAGATAIERRAEPWHATLVASDAAGNRASVRLGRIGGLTRLPP